MQTRISLSVFCVSILLLVFFSFTSTQAALSWTTITVDQNASAQSGSSIAVDSNNIPHIAYSAMTDDGYYIMYASWNGSGFSVQRVAQGGYPYSLVFDANNKPHILYVGNLYSDRPLMYASSAGEGWNLQNTGITDSIYAQLALDSSGNPDIAYTKGNTLNYASWTGNGWSKQPIDKASDVISKVSFALNSHDKPYILYSPSSYSDNNLLATYENSTWNIQTVPLPPPTGDVGNLVIDANDAAHFICTRHHFVSFENMSIISTVFYVSWNGTAWDTQTVVSDAGLNSVGFLALDSNGEPHILSLAANGKILYNTRAGDAWNIGDSNISAVKICSFALDSGGSPHISYQSYAIGYFANLTYATVTGTPETPTPTIPAMPTVLSTYPILAGIAVAVVVAVIAVSYIWRRKRSPKGKT
jgi:hypothetical protein